MKIVFSIALLVLVLLSSCEEKKTAEVISSFPSDTIVIGNDYPDINSELVLKVMEELRFCTSNDTIVSLPPCTNEYFRIFNVGPNVNWKDGFLLEMRAGLFNTPVKQLIVVQKGFNTYKIINQYFGFLIEQRTTKSGYNDLLMGYQDEEIGIVAIKHTWDGKRYSPIDVEEINGYYVKKELKDSINHLFIDNFYAGH
jgi:hypothetical protein